MIVIPKKSLLLLICVFAISSIKTVSSKSKIAENVFEDESWHVELFGTGLIESPEKVRQNQAIKAD